MRRPRTSPPLDTPTAGRWLDPAPPGGSGEGVTDPGGGYLHRRRAWAAVPEGARRRATMFAGGKVVGSSSSTTVSSSSSSSSTSAARREQNATTTAAVAGAAKAMLYQLVLWPLTLCMMLVSSGYRSTLRVGCRGSALRFRDPPRWLVRLVSKPSRLINPPVSFGADNLKRCVGGAGVAGVATEAAGGHQAVDCDGGDTAGGGTPGEGGARATAAAAEGDTTAAAATGSAPSPPRPVLLVGNQSLLGLDSLAVLNEVQGLTGVYPRFLYDTLFGFVPGVKQLLEAAGGVAGTTGNCESLMSAGRCLLLYPGGAREAFKGAEADKYELMWHEKIGFARLAVKHGYSLLPFASVGLEDAVTAASFGLDVSWLARQAEPKRDAGGSSRLRLPFLLPHNSLERQYFAFGEPIETAHLGGDWENAAKCVGVYDKAKEEVERLIAHLQQVQQRDPDRFLPRRAWRRFRKIFGGLQGGEASW